MLTVKIDRRQFDALAEKILKGKVIGAALDAAALEVKGKISKYPKRRYGKQAFVSDKQRRGFFAKLKAGEIEVPYRRGLSRNSQKLGQSWVVESRGALTRIIGTRVSYAPLVQGEQQTNYHKVTGWKKAEDVVQQNAARISAVMNAAVKKVI